MTDDDLPDLSSFSESDLPDTPKDSPSPRRPAAQSPQQLPYAPVFPKGSPQPIPLGYSGPATRSPQQLHPVIAFIGGMIAAVVVPTVCIVPLKAEGPVVVILFLVVAVPFVMLFFRSTRFFGVGWLTTYALGFSALFVICGMK